MTKSMKYEVYRNLIPTYDKIQSGSRKILNLRQNSKKAHASHPASAALCTGFFVYTLKFLLNTIDIITL